MFRKFFIGSACAIMVAFAASDVNAFHGRHHRGKSCGNVGYSYSVPVQFYYCAPTYTYGGCGYGHGRSSYYRPSYYRPSYYGSSYYRPPVSVGFGGLPYYRSGFGSYGLGGYGFSGYPGYGFGRRGMSIGLGGFGRGW